MRLRPVNSEEALRIGLSTLRRAKLKAISPEEASVLGLAPDTSGYDPGYEEAPYRYDPPKVTTAIPPDKPGAFESFTSGLVKAPLSMATSVKSLFDPEAGLRDQQNIEAALPSPGFSGFAGQAIGSILPTALAVAAPPLAVPVMAGYALSGAGSGREVVEGLQQRGVDIGWLKEAATAAGFAASELVPETIALKRFAALAVRKFGKEVGEQIAQEVAEKGIKTVAKGLGIEATQEAATQVGQSGIEAGLDPNKDFISPETAKEVGLAAAGGAIGGAALGGGINLANRYGQQAPQRPQTPPPSQTTVAPPPAPQVPLQPESAMSPESAATRDAVLSQMAEANLPPSEVDPEIAELQAMTKPKPVRARKVAAVPAEAPVRGSLTTEKQATISDWESPPTMQDVLSGVMDQREKTGSIRESGYDISYDEDVGAFYVAHSTSGRIIGSIDPVSGEVLPMEDSKSPEKDTTTLKGVIGKLGKYGSRYKAERALSTLNYAKDFPERQRIIAKYPDLATGVDKAVQKPPATSTSAVQKPAAPARPKEAWEMTRGKVESSIKGRYIRGDKLLDAMDLADDLAKKGAEIGDDGLVTLYHRTTESGAKGIVKTGRMVSKEDRLFFGTHPEGQIEGYGDAVVKVRLPLEKLELNDVFPNEAHVTLMGRTASVKADLWTPDLAPKQKAEVDPKAARRAELKALAKKALGLSDKLGVQAGLTDTEILRLRKLLKEEAVSTFKEFDRFIRDLIENISDSDISKIWKQAQLEKEEAKEPVFDEGKVGLRQVDNAAFMESIGKAGFEKEEVVEWEASRDRALKNDKVNIEWAREKAESLIDNPEETLYSHEDHAALVMVVHKLQKARFEASDRAAELRKLGDAVSLKAAEVLDAQVGALLLDEENLRRGGQKGTSNFGRGLQAARMLDNGEEFTRAAIEKKISDTTGKALTADQERIAKEQSDKIADLESRLKKAEDDQAKQRERIAVLEADREIAKRKQQARSSGRKVVIEDIDARIAANKVKFKALGREFHAGIFSDAEVKLWAEQIYLYAEKYGIKAVDAADKLIAELGDPTVKSSDILSAISAVSEKHKARRRAAAVRYRNKMKALRELADSINPNNVKDSKKKLQKITDDYVKVDPQDKRLVKVLRKIERVQELLDRAEIITPHGIRKDADVIEMAREELRELNTQMDLRRREADINRQIANGKLDTPLLREKAPDSIDVKKARADLSLAKNKLQKMIDSQAKLTTGDKVKGAMQTVRGLVFGLDLAGTMFTRGAEFTTAYPVQSSKIHAKGATGFFSEDRAARYHNEMLSHSATALFMSDDPTYLRDPNGDHTNADELFSNAMLEAAAKRKMTRVFGIPIKVLNAGNEASNRAYALGVNGMLDVLAEDYMSRNPYATKAERLEAIKWFKNLMGRGDFQVIDKKTGKLKDGYVENLIKGGQMIGSAPRILASNIRSPFLTINALFNFSNRPLQQMAIRQVGLYWGTRAAFVAILMALSEALDWDLEFTHNPYSSDFGQIKKGNTRWNVFGPMRSVMRAEALLVLAAMPEAANPFAGTEAHKAYRSQAPEMMILKAAVGNRINPPVRLGVGLIFGTDWRGKEASRWQILREGVTPMWSQNVYDGVYDALDNGGSFLDAAGIGALSHVGQDFNTYPDRSNQKAVSGGLKRLGKFQVKEQPPKPKQLRLK